MVVTQILLARIVFNFKAMEERRKDNPIISFPPIGHGLDFKKQSFDQQQTPFSLNKDFDIQMTTMPRAAPAYAPRASGRMSILSRPFRSYQQMNSEPTTPLNLQPSFSRLNSSDIRGLEIRDSYFEEEAGEAADDINRAETPEWGPPSNWRT